jgi:hypothetical protein
LKNPLNKYDMYFDIKISLYFKCDRTSRLPSPCCITEIYKPTYFISFSVQEKYFMVFSSVCSILDKIWVYHQLANHFRSKVDKCNYHHEVVQYRIFLVVISNVIKISVKELNQEVSIHVSGKKRTRLPYLPITKHLGHWKKHIWNWIFKKNW